MEKTGSKIYPLTLILLSSFCALFFSLAISLRQTEKVDQVAIHKDSQCVYFRLQHESNPFIPEMSDYVALNTALNHADSFMYYEIYSQPLFVNEYTDPSQAFFCDEPNVINAIQISQNVQKDFALSLQSGRFLSTGDYSSNGTNHIPVLMGYNYLDSFKIGDVFSSDYLFDPYTFNVVGFLENGAHIETSLFTYELDSCVVIPSFNVENISESTDGLLIHCSNQTSGVARASITESSVAYNELETLLKDNAAGSYTVYSSLLGLDLQQRYGIRMNQILYSSIIISVVLLAASIFFAIKGNGKPSKLATWWALFLLSVLNCTVLVTILQLILSLRINLIFALAMNSGVCASLFFSATTKRKTRSKYLPDNPTS